ncbi:MAG TPA: IPT/TIG domain-containing protein, partial [Gemmataceae bacterium]|nr:IPT/TIG domain-containing protein [Gemmataceae bacterium]
MDREYGFKIGLFAVIAILTAQGAKGANALPVPSSGVYLGIWANPALAQNQEQAVEILEGPSPNGINYTFALHLVYYQWTDIAAMLDANGILQPDLALAGDISHGRVPVISWQCDSSVADSDHVIAGGNAAEDAIITATANALKQYPGPVMLRWFWEFNDLANSNHQICRGDTGGAPTAQVYSDFIGAWQHIWALFQKAGATNVVFLWNPGDYTGNPNKAPQGFYPGNQYVDWIGIDTYQNTPSGTFVTNFGQFYSDFSASQYGKPLMVGENGAEGFSINNREIQATYLQGLLSDIKNGTYPLLKGYDYFDSPGNAPNNWVLDSQGGLAEYAALAASGAFLPGPVNTPVVPAISKIANAEGQDPVIAANTWVEVLGSNLAPAGDIRTWQGSDFVAGQMPTSLDGVSVTVNGLAAYIYYISPTQINILTPPNLGSGPVSVVVTNNNTASASFTAQAQSISPSFFVFSDGQHVAAAHTNGNLVGAASLSVPGYTFAPAQPGETVEIFANGFGATSSPVVAGSSTQSGTLSPLPSMTIGGITATVQFAGLISPGLFQFNVVVPAKAGGDEPIVATYGGMSTQSGALLTVAGAAPPPTSVSYYVAPNGKDSWSG